MKQQHKPSITAGAVAILLCLPGFSTPAAAGQAGNDAPPPSAGGTSGAATQDAGQGEGQPEDVVDRFFAPLDNAVSDINRDLNQGDAGTSSGPDDPTD